jgi:hypothetical protein
MDRLGIRPGVRVADIEAGSGYYTVRLARRLGPGATIYAEDIKPDYLKQLEARLRRDGIEGVTVESSCGAAYGRHGTPPALHHFDCGRQVQVNCRRDPVDTRQTLQGAGLLVLQRVAHVLAALLFAALVPRLMGPDLRPLPPGLARQ